MQQPPQVISSSQVFNKNEFYQKGFLTQSQISQTPHGIHQVTTTEYPKDSTIVKLISSNAPGAVTQVSPSFQVQSRVRINNRHSTPPGHNHSRTIIRHSESPIRYVTESISPGRTTTYQERQIPVAAVVKEQIPLYIIEQQRQPVQIQERFVEVEKPIYIEKIVEVSTDQSIQVKQLSERIAILEQNNRQLVVELEHYKNQQPQVVHVENTDRINDLQREIERLNDENERVKKSGRQNQSDVQKVAQDRDQYEGKIRELLIQIEHLNSLLNEKQQEISNLNIRITQIQNSEVRQSDARTADHISKINILTQEIDRLTKQMKLSREQYDDDKQKLHAKIQDYEQRFVFLSAEVERLRGNQSDNIRINQLETRIREQEITIQQKEIQLNEWRSKFTEIEKALSIYKQYEQKLYECETVNAQLRKKIDELMQANRRSAEIEALQAENQSLQIKIRQLLEQIDTLNSLVAQKDSELQRLKLEINHLTINVRQSGVNQQEEINRLNELILQRNREVEELRRRVTEIDFLSQKVRAYEERIREQEQLILQLQRTIEDLKGQLDSNERVKKSAKNDNKNLEDKLVQLTTQNQFLQQRIESLERDLQAARLRVNELEQSSSRVLIFEQRIREQEQLILQLQRTIEELKGQLDSNERIKKSAKNDNKNLEDKLVQLSTQNQFQQQRIESLERDLQAARLRVSELEQSSSRVLIFEQRIREQEQLILQLQRTIEELRGQIEEAERVKRSSKNTNQANEEKVGQLTVQINFFQTRVSQLEQELVAARKRILELEQTGGRSQVLEEKINQLNVQINLVNQENARLQEQLRFKDDELNKLRIQVQQLNINITQLGGSRDELIRLQELLNRRNADYEELSRKYAQYSQYENKLQECEMNNVQLRKRIEDLLQDSVKKSSRVVELENALREGGNLQEKLISATQTIEVLQRRIQGLEQELNQSRLRLVEFENASRTIQELEIRIRSLMEQNERLTQIINQKEGELQKMRQEISQLNIRIQQSGVSSEELNLRIRELEQHKQRIRELEQQLINLRSFEGRYAELEQVNAQLRNQIDNLQRQLMDIQNQANDERVKKSKQQNNLEEALRDRNALEEKLVHMTTQIDFFNRKVQSLEQELANLRQRNAQLESASITITQLESRVQQLTQTIERLNVIINEKEQELIRLRQENGQLQINIRQSGINQEEVLRFRREIDELRRLLQEKETIIIQLRPYQDKLAECERNNAELRARIEQLLGQYNEEQVKKSRASATADQSAREKALLEQQINQLNITIEGLNKRQALLDQEFQKLRLRNSELENATRSSGTYEIKITALTEEVSKLRALLAQRDNELNQLRLEIQQLHLSTRQSQVIQQEVTRLQEALARANRENEELKSRIREFEMIVIQLQQRESRIKDLENENGQLRRRIEELMGQMNDEKVKKSQRDNRSDQELVELRAKLQEALNNNQKLVFENTRLSEQLQIVAKDNEKLRQTIVQLEQQLSSYKTFELKVQQYERTITELRQRIEELIIQLNDSNEDRVKKQRQLSELEIKLRQISSYEEKIALLVSTNEQLNIKIRQLESQLIQLQQYASLAQQNETLVVRIRSLEQEISSYRLVIENIRRQLIEWESTYTKIQGYNSLVEVVKSSLTQIQVVSSQSVVRYSTQVVKN